VNLSRLADYPFDMVHLACEKCTRKGQYLKSSLIRRFRPDQDIVDLRLILAADCPKVIANRATDLCGASTIPTVSAVARQTAAPPSCSVGYQTDKLPLPP